MLCREGLQGFDAEDNSTQKFKKWSEIHHLTFSLGPKHCMWEKSDAQIWNERVNSQAAERCRSVWHLDRNAKMVILL